jgi:hypothetical protein
VRRAVGSRAVAIPVARATRVAVALAACLLLAWSAGPTLAMSAPPLPAGAWRVTEHFRLTTADASSSRQHVRATGPFTARGYALAGDFASGHAVTRLEFRRGVMRLVTKATHRSASVPNPSTCKFTELFRGNYVIRGGAGRYRYASGSGTYVSRISGKLKKARGGGCGARLASFWQSTRTRGSLHR